MISASVRGKLGDFILEASFEVPGYGVSALYGRSGSGKTSIFRWMAGLEQNFHGKLSVNGEIWQDTEKNIFLRPHERRVGYVFQEADLFPHLNVKKNLEFGSKRSNESHKTSLEEVAHFLGLNSLLYRFPDRLSGGERQRVAIARALLAQPKILLMDEPLAALDIHSKLEILPYLERLKETTKIPFLYIAHSQEEVLRFADYLIELEVGKVLRSGNPRYLLNKDKAQLTASVELPLVERVKKILHMDGLLVEDAKGDQLIIKIPPDKNHPEYI